MMKLAAIAVLLGIHATAVFAQATAESRGTAVIGLIAKDGAESEARAYALLAARIAAETKSGEPIDATLPPKDLICVLRERRPDDLIVVLPRMMIDLNLQRRIFAAAAAIDPDPFIDCDWGYITGRDAALASAFWERTRIDSAAVQSRPAGKWLSLSVTSGMKSATYPGHIPEAAKLSGFTGDSHYVATREADAANLEYFKKVSAAIRHPDVLTVTGNGDPTAIWLFADSRNRDRSKHHPFTPEAVGADPKGEMTRLFADDIRKLDLKGTVVWSGTCHSGATGRVFVEGDIVSTFGTVDRPTVYELPASRSLALAYIEAGCAALVAPIGPNHGMSVMRETEDLLLRGTTLGVALKSTADDLVLAEGKTPAMDEYRAGVESGARERIMVSGGINRALFGDPRRRVAGPVLDPAEKITISRADGHLVVVVERRSGFHANAWNMFGKDRAMDHMVTARIEWTEAPADFSRPPVVTVQATGKDDRPIEVRADAAIFERFRGKTYLHMRALGKRADFQDGRVRVTFTIS